MFSRSLLQFEKLRAGKVTIANGRKRTRIEEIRLFHSRPFAVSNSSSSFGHRFRPSSAFYFSLMGTCVKFRADMASIQDSSERSPENWFLPLARTLGRSRMGQVFAALLTLIFFAGLAYIAYYNRDFTVLMVVVLLVLIGLKKAWNCLPFARATRQRWALQAQLWQKHEKMLRGHPAYAWRYLAFIGVFGFVNQLWKTHFSALPPAPAIAADASFVLIGLAGVFLCQRAIRQAEASESQKA